MLPRLLMMLPRQSWSCGNHSGSSEEGKSQKDAEEQNRACF